MTAIAHRVVLQGLPQKRVLDCILEEPNCVDVEDFATVLANEKCVDDEGARVGLFEPELTIVRKTAHPKDVERAQHNCLALVQGSTEALNLRW